MKRIPKILEIAVKISIVQSSAKICWHLSCEYRGKEKDVKIQAIEDMENVGK